MDMKPATSRERLLGLLRESPSLAGPAYVMLQNIQKRREVRVDCIRT